MTISISWLSFMVKWLTIQNLKMFSTSCANAHRDVTTFEVDGMV